MDFTGVRSYILERLKNELSCDLCYHSLEHTLDVLQATERLATLENVNSKDLILLKTGALFHDAGYLRTYDGHEKASVEIAREVLPEFGYSENEILIIEKLILCTEIPQHPTSHLEKIMADADLDYLGRDDIFMTGQKLQYEWKKFGIVSSLREWHERQLEFLKNHKYFTGSAVRLRDKGKQENIRELEKLIGRNSAGV
jgi:hypothetical protein